MDRQNSKMTTGISGLFLGKQGRHEDDRPGVIMQELTGYQLTQLAVFPEQMPKFQTGLMQLINIDQLADISASARTSDVLLLRPEFTKFWLVRQRGEESTLSKALAQYFPLDLTGSKVVMRLSGADAARLINRFCAVDLSCPKGKFLTTALHHVPVHILKASATAYLLFLPRSYAESLAELLHHSALQFGVDVKSVAEWDIKK